MNGLAVYPHNDVLENDRCMSGAVAVQLDLSFNSKTKQKMSPIIKQSFDMLNVHI